MLCKLITNANGKLEKDVRIQNKNNSLIISKWDKHGCIQRTIINQFDEIDRSNRDVTNFINNNTNGDTNVTLE